MSSMLQPTSITQCPSCGQALRGGELACPQCQWLLHAPRLREIAQEASQLEVYQPLAAAEAWARCLPLLPPQSTQAEQIRGRIDLLVARQAGAAPGLPGGSSQADTWKSVLWKTGGSMLLSIVIYAQQWGGVFATGFVLLILIHELGHVLAMRRFGLKAGPPVFIPFMGAIINLKQMPRNAAEEAIVGIGGPLTGTIGALACFGLYWGIRWRPGMGDSAELALELAYFGFLLNLFNLLPVPPLDGGRVTAAVSPWIWMLGVPAAGAMWVYQWLHYGRLDVILTLLLIFALPRVWNTLRHRQNQGAYYQVSRRASRGIGAVYFGLGLALTGLFVWCHLLLSAT